MFGSSAETVVQLYKVPDGYPWGYPEAIRDPSELNALLAYFMPYVEAGKIDKLVVWGSMRNPLNIEHVARMLNIQCPPGYSLTEMEKRVNTLVPCRVCGDMIALYSCSYAELGGRCNWDCLPEEEV